MMMATLGNNRKMAPIEARRKSQSCCEQMCLGPGQKMVYGLWPSIHAEILRTGFVYNNPGKKKTARFEHP